MNLSVSSTAAGGATGATSLPAASVTGVQTLNVRAVSTTAADVTTVVAGNFTGVTAINADRAISAVTVTGMANTTSSGIIGNGTAVQGNTSFTYATTATTPVLNISGGTTGTGTVTVVAAGATTSTINSTGAANTIGNLTFSNTAVATSAVVINAATNLTTGTVATTAATITLNGAATLVTLGAITDANLTTINASGMTAGGVSATLIATVTSFTGGAGADTITTIATTGSTATINGGAGAADILVVADQTSLSTSALGGRFTNFEIIRNTSGASIDLNNISGETSLQIGADVSGFTNMTAALAAAVTVRTGAATATLALANATGTSDVLNLNFANATATTGNTLGGTALTVNGFETINATSTNGASGSHNVLSFATGGGATSLTAINISGSKPFDLVTATAQNTKAMAVTAAGLTYASTSDTDFAFTYTGALIQGSSVVGSGSSDSFTLSSAAGTAGQFVTYDGGAGNDAFSSTVAIINNNAGATASAKIEGGAGTDTLTITGAATMVDNNFQFLTGLERVTFTGTGALSLVSGGFFNTNFASGVRITDTAHADGAGADFVINLGTYTGNATIIGTTVATVTANANPSITTGSGADTITLSAAALTTGNITINSGAGIDTITVTTGAQTTGVTTITAGTGADVITWAAADANAAGVSTMAMTIAAGDSTTTAYDQVTGFDVGTAGLFGSTITFAAKAITAYAATAATGYTAAQLTVAVSGAGAAKGAVTFAGTSSSTLSVADKIAAVQSVVTTNNGDTCFFVDNGSTYIFNNNTTTDSVVQLVGTTVVLLDTTNATTAGLIFLA